MRVAWIAKNNVKFYDFRVLKYSTCISFGWYSLVFTIYDQFIPEKELLNKKLLDANYKVDQLEKKLEQVKEILK